MGGKQVLLHNSCLGVSINFGHFGMTRKKYNFNLLFWPKSRNSTNSKKRYKIYNVIFLVQATVVFGF